MRIEIRGRTEQMIQDQLARGAYSTPQQVVEEAVRRLVQSGVSTSTKPRQGGQWHGQVVIADDFDDLPDDLQKAFGMTKP